MADTINVLDHCCCEVKTTSRPRRTKGLMYWSCLEHEPRQKLSQDSRLIQDKTVCWDLTLLVRH